MRTDKELIKICIDNHDNYDYSGLCIFALRLVGRNLLSHQEEERLVSIFCKYIKRNTLWNNFLYNKARISSYKYLDENTFFWNSYEKEPRLKYLQYLYNKLK